MSNARCAGDTSDEICRGDVCPVSSASVQCPPTPDYSHEGGGTSDHHIITTSHTINQFDFSAPRDCSHQCKSNLSADGCFLNFPLKIKYHNISPNMINTSAHAPLGGSSCHQPNQMEPYGWEFWQLVFPSPSPLL